MNPTNDKECPTTPSPEPKPGKWSKIGEGGWTMSEDSDSDSSSIAYTYVTVESTNMTMSDLPGPGRLLGNLYSFLGKKLEYKVLETNARRLGADPGEIGARIRSLPIWIEDAVPFKYHVKALEELGPKDARVQRRCCRAMLFYMSTGVYQTVVSGLREIIDLSIKYFPVRDAFNAVKTPDFLRLLPLHAKQAPASLSAQELRVVESLVKKAQLCLVDNLLYSACRKSFSLSSWSPELEGVELRLTLEGFLDHKRLSLLAADLIIFYGLEQKISDPRKIDDFVQSLPFWAEHKHKKHVIGIEDLAYSDRDILERCCRNLILYLNLPELSFKVAALEVVSGLSRRYRSVREIFVNIGATEALQELSKGDVQNSSNSIDQLKMVQNLAAEALFSIENNEIYDLLKDSTFRKSWTPEAEGAVLRLELEQYLFHPKLKAMATEHISFIELTGCTFQAFERHARHILDPNWGQFGPEDKNDLTLNRACFVLAKFATGCSSVRTRVEACKYIDNVIFSRPSSRAFFNELDLSGRLSRAGAKLQPPNGEAEMNAANRLSSLSKRITLCLQDHEVFPNGVAYFQELDDTLLDLIFDYLRSPELFFIGAKVLAKTWLKVIYLYEDMFLRVVTFVLDSLEEIARYDEAEFLIVSVLEKFLFEQRLPSQVVTDYPAKCWALVNAICSPRFQSVYPVAYSTIQEYREDISALPVLSNSRPMIF